MSRKICGSCKKSILLGFVIPTKAGIQLFHQVLDSGFHRSDGLGTFYDSIKSAFSKKNPLTDS